MTYRWRSAAATLVVALSAAAAAAQVVPATVTLLFPRAMQIPGQTLDSGAYTFRIEPARGELEFVHIAPADGSARPVRVLAIGRERPPVYGETYHTYGPNPVDAVALRAGSIRAACSNTCSSIRPNRRPALRLPEASRC